MQTASAYANATPGALSGANMQNRPEVAKEPPRIIESRFAELEAAFRHTDSRIATLRERLTPAMGQALPCPVKNQGPRDDAQCCSTVASALGGYIAMLESFNERLDDMIQRVEL